jgi:hypothetical protein
LKKILVLCLCLLLLALSACGGGANAGAKFPSVSTDGTTEGGRSVAPAVTRGLHPTASPAVADSQNAQLGSFTNIPDSSLHRITADEAIDIANAAGDPGEGADSPVPDEAAPYVGLWHASPVLGSGWSERYLLCYDGTFLWIASQMDGEARTRYVYGTWSVSGGNIELDVQLILRLEGGTLGNSPSTVTGKDIEAGTLTPYAVGTYAVGEIFTLPLTAPEIDPDMLPDREMYAITIDGAKYWYYASEDDNNAASDEFWEAMYALESASAPTAPTTPAASSGAWQSAYDKVLAAYREAILTDFTDFDEDVVSSELWLQRYDHKNLAADVYYARYDIDGNGTPELVVTVDQGELWIFDIFAFDGRNAVRLIESASLGYRAWAYITADGVISLWSGEGAGFGYWDFFRIAPDGHTLSVIERIGSDRGENWDDDPESLIYYHGNGKDEGREISRDEYIKIAGKYLAWDGEYLSGSIAPMDWKLLAGGDQANTSAQTGAVSGQTEILGLNGADLSASEEEVLELAAGVLELMKNEDWGALGALVHPTQSVTFSPYGFIDTKTAAKLGAGDVKALGVDESVRTWGVYDGSGEAIKLSFTDYCKRFIFDRDFTEAPQIGVNRITQSGNTALNLNVFGNGGAYVSFNFPGTSGAENDWASLYLAFSWFDGDDAGHPEGLYLVGVVHDKWTI